MIGDREFAASVVDRLNQLLASAPELGGILRDLCEATVPVPDCIVDHPTIQVRTDGDVPQVGFLGVLNGIAGAIPGGPRAGWGHITAHADSETGKILRFSLTEIG